MRRVVCVVFAVLGMTPGASGVVEAEYRGAADLNAVVADRDVRFTVLTPALIRMEWSPGGAFEDRASQVFIRRHLPVPKFDVTSEGPWLKLDSGELTLRYTKGSGKFDRNNLSIEFSLNGRPVLWRPGMKGEGNLLGTCRTLDGVSGSAALAPGLISRDGWALVDDTPSLVFAGEDPQWLTPRRNKQSVDWYFFGHGHDYKRALQDFTKVAGRIPLPPRYVFGTWWSRYWAYSDAELQALVGEFDEHEVPLDVLVVDMDWHLDGWTGYTWNPQYFPDPEGFLQWAHAKGLRTTLNLHPADGVGRHEAAFEQMAEAMGLDAEMIDSIPFDSTDPRFMDAYFRTLHHPLERQGVDFWWIDWQQGEGTKIAGLDPLWWLNHLHWKDMERRAEQSGRRPLIFSRWGGLGNHRYQIGFSGDTFCNWPSLAFQPFFTATAGNVGFAYWSHDIGGHQPGPVDPELYARWIQYGVFSPILRTHTTKNPKAERRIWEFPKEVYESAKSAFQLRYELIPYIYSAARQCYDTGVPFCRPLYYEWPELNEAYEHGEEYLFGDSLLVAPVTEPSARFSGCAQVKVWLPPGDWTNWFTGRRYRGPVEVRLLVPLGEIPLFVRGGAIIPAMRKMLRSDERPVDPLVLHIWPGKSGETRVYEDDGISVDYQDRRFSVTPISHETADGKLAIALGPAEGSFEGMLTQREYQIRVRDAWPPESITIKSDTASPTGAGRSAMWSYEPDTQSIVIRVPRRSVRDRIEFLIAPHAEFADTAPLRNGLRGQLSNLLAIKKLLEEAGIMATGQEAIGSRIDNALHVLGDGDEPPLKRREAATSIQAGWEDLLAGLLHTSESGEIRRRALVRLLGLYHKVRVTAAGEAGDELLAEVEILPTSTLPAVKNLQASVRLRVEGPWHIEGKKVWQLPHLSETTPLIAKAKLVGEGLTQTGLLQAEIEIRVNGDTITLPVQQAFMPSINHWWVLGPFDAPFETALDMKFPPEEEIDLKAHYKGQGGEQIAWREVRRAIEPRGDLTNEFFVDFDDVFGSRKYDAVVYALVYLMAPRAMDATLALGSDDGAVVWLNDREIHRIDVGRAYSSKQDRLPLELRKGANTLLIKIKQGRGDWGLGAHIETPGGDAMPEVRSALRPADDRPTP